MYEYCFFTLIDEANGQAVVQEKLTKMGAEGWRILPIPLPGFRVVMERKSKKV